ncbi:MAG: hypothetical protein ACP5Q4_06285 [Candidatus Caldatribacteriaceae bacterium]
MGENQYRLAYKLWQVVREGPEKGKEYVGVSFEAIRTLEEIKSAVVRFKEERGQEH